MNYEWNTFQNNIYTGKSIVNYEFLGKAWLFEGYNHYFHQQAKQLNSFVYMIQSQYHKELESEILYGIYSPPSQH